MACPAWWSTLGAGIGCVLLATLFAVPLRRTAVETLPQYLVCTFGRSIRPFVAVSDSIGIFLTIPGQAASAITLLTVLRLAGGTGVLSGWLAGHCVRFYGRRD